MTTHAHKYIRNAYTSTLTLTLTSAAAARFNRTPIARAIPTNLNHLGLLVCLSRSSLNAYTTTEHSEHRLVENADKQEIAWRVRFEVRFLAIILVDTNDITNLLCMVNNEWRMANSHP